MTDVAMLFCSPDDFAWLSHPVWSAQNLQESAENYSRY